MYYQSANQYATWYAFKKDLERQLGYSLLNWRWIEVKPKSPLPWSKSHMRATISVLALSDKHTTKKKG